VVDDLEEIPVPETETHPPTGDAVGEEIDEEIADRPVEEIDDDL
jgi:hypothetical protein